MRNACSEFFLAGWAWSGIATAWAMVAAGGRKGGLWMGVAVAVVVSRCGNDAEGSSL